MTNLLKQAQAADEAMRASVKDAQRKERAKSLAKIRENWNEPYGGFGQFDPIPALPPEDAFTRVSNVPTDSHRNERVSGWRVTVDGIDFLRVTDYGAEEWRVFVTCPACGQEMAVSFHGPSGLGERLRLQRGILPHKCRENEARSVAYAIGSAARDAKVSDEEIVRLAYELHGDLISRLRHGR